MFLDVDINKLVDQITEITSKLSPLAQHVWSVYIRQQYVIGIQQLVWAVLLSIAVGVGIPLTRKLWRTLQRNRYNGEAYVGFVFACFALPAAALGAMALVSDAISHLINPEYGAIQALLNR